MHPSLRPLLIATGAFLLSALNASAQFIELVTEAPATLTLVLTTATTTTNEAGTERKTTAITARVDHPAILQSLVDDGTIPDSSTLNWSLRAVNYAPADLAYVNGYFLLYAVNGETRVQIPSSKFLARSFGAVEKYKERHLGQYVLSSAGTVTNHVSYDFLPSIQIAGSPYNLNESTSDGFASINYVTKDIADGFEVLFYAISNLRGTTRGSFKADAGEGLMTLTVSLGAAKLVPASFYPEAETFPGLNDSE